MGPLRGSLMGHISTEKWAKKIEGSRLTLALLNLFFLSWPTPFLSLEWHTNSDEGPFDKQIVGPGVDHLASLAELLSTQLHKPSPIMPRIIIPGLTKRPEKK